MKQLFIASLCKGGILGGCILASEDGITYKTGKVTVPAAIRNLEMKYDKITGLTRGRVLLFPAVTIEMENGEAWRFIIFGRNRFLRLMEEKGIPTDPTP